MGLVLPNTALIPPLSISVSASPQRPQPRKPHSVHSPPHSLRKENQAVKIFKTNEMHISPNPPRLITTISAVSVCISEENKVRKAWINHPLSDCSCSNPQSWYSSRPHPPFPPCCPKENPPSPSRVYQGPPRRKSTFPCRDHWLEKSRCSKCAWTSFSGLG